MEVLHKEANHEFRPWCRLTGGGSWLCQPFYILFCKAGPLMSAARAQHRRRCVVMFSEGGSIDPPGLRQAKGIYSRRNTAVIDTLYVDKTTFRCRVLAW